MAVYDDEKTKVSDDQLRDITGIGRGEEDQMGAAARDGAAADRTRGLGAAALEKAEQSPGLSSGFGAKGSSEADALKQIGKKATGTRGGGMKRFKAIFWGSPLRKGLSVAGAGGGITGLIIGGALFVMPMLKIPSAISSIQNTFFASSRQIGDTITERLFTQYIIKKLIPGMITERCESSNVNRKCAHPGNADTYVGKLYNAWRDGRIEQKLFDRYGFEITQTNGRWIMRANGIETTDLGRFDGSEEQRAGFERNAIQALTRTEARVAMNTMMKETTNMEGRHMRQAGAVLSRKYGIPRTLFSARVQDWKDTNVTSRLNAGRAILNQRVVGMYSESLALAMNCAMDRNFACLDAETDDKGFKRTKFHNELRVAAQDYAAKYGQQAFDDMIAESESIKQKGLAAHYVEKLVGQVAGTAGKATVQVGTKAIPVIGWIDLAIVLGTVLDKAPEMYPAVVYGLNSQQMVAAFGTYAVAGDEFKAGDTDLAAYGSLAQTLDATNTADGLYGAEASPALAASTGKQVDRTVRCNDGGEPGETQEGILCPEESLMPSSSSWLAAADIGIDIILGPAFEYVAVAWNYTVGWVFDQAGAFVGWLAENLIPGYDKLMEYAGETMGKMFTFFTDMLMPPLIAEDSSGDRIMNTVTAGGAIVAQDTCESMGCHAVSTEEYVVATTQQLQKEQQEFNQQSVFARMFDIEEPNSLLSKVALGTPSSTDGWISTTASFFTNPLRYIGSSFGATNNAYAASGSVGSYVDALYLTPQGIGADEPVMTCDDCEAFEAELNCSDPNDPNRMKWWETTAKRDWPDAWDPQGTAEQILAGGFAGTGQYYYTETNPCLTFQSVASSAGCEFDEELCELQFGAGDTGATAPPAAGDGSFGTSTDMRALAQQVLDNSNITIGTAFDNPRQQMVNLANGTNTANCNISPNVLNLILYIAQNHTIYITSINRYCAGIRTASGNFSFHWKDKGGHAVDIGIVDGMSSTGGSAKDLALLREIAPMLPNGAQLGQVQCRPAGSITTPPGVLQFNDSCNHIHISMPVYAY